MTKALVISRRSGLLQGVLAGPFGATFQPKVCHCLREAVFDGAEGPLDLVVADLPSLPSSEWIWADRLRPRIGSAALVAIAEEGDANLRRWLSSDFDGLLLDPFDLQQVQATLLRALERRPHQRPPSPGVLPGPEPTPRAATSSPMEADTADALARFLQGLAHEVNNPLASVLGILQVVQADNQDPILEARYQAVRRELDRVQVTLRELEYFVAVRKPNRELVDLVPLLQQLDSEPSPSWEIRCDHAMVMGDSDQLRTALRRLCELAAGPENSPVQRSLELRSPDLLIRISGRPGTELPADPMTLFLPYHRTTHHAYLESLRLAACHGIVRAHRGRLGAESHSGELRLELALPMTEIGPRYGTEQNPESGDGGGA